MPTLPALPREDDEPLPSPIRRCGCGNAIGDGDYASGKRTCVLCRRPPKRWTTLPTPRR